jgi:hypothetical protein
LGVFSSQTYADPNADALKAIAETADRICGTVAAAGSYQNTEVTGDVKAQLRGLAKYLADLGISGTGSISSDEYVGLLRSDLPSALGSIRDCKLKVFEKLEQKLIAGSEQSGMAHPQGIVDQGGVSARESIGSQAEQPKEDRDIRDFFRADSVKMTAGPVTVRPAGLSSISVTFWIENRSDLPIQLGIDLSPTSVGSCIGPGSLSGLNAVNTHLSESLQQRGMSYLPPTGRVAVTANFNGYVCSLDSKSRVTLTTSLIISAKKKTFRLPVSADTFVQ